MSTCLDFLSIVHRNTLTHFNISHFINGHIVHSVIFTSITLL